MQRWLYHPELGSKIFKDKEIEEKREQGWYDSPKLFPPIYAPLQPVETPVEVPPAVDKGRQELRDVPRPRRFFKGNK